MGLKPAPFPKGKMKRFVGLLIALLLVVLCAVPALAAGLSISPPSVEFDVPADGSTEVDFLVYDFSGDLEISLEGIPLRVEPTTVPVIAKEEGTRVVLTFYGDESLGSQVFTGKIRFLAMTGGTVAMGIKVRATITQTAAVAGGFAMPVWGWIAIGVVALALLVFVISRMVRV